MQVGEIFWQKIFCKYEKYLQRKWTNGSVSSVCALDSDLNQLYTPAIPTGASSVLDLTHKFDNNNNNNSSSCSGEAGGLKRVASVSSGEQFRVSRLEAGLGALSCTTTPASTPLQHRDWVK